MPPTILAVLLLLLLQPVTPVDTAGFSADQRFWYGVILAVVPIVLGTLTLVGTALAIWQSRQATKTARVAVAEVAANTLITAATHKEVGEVHEKVNGHGEELRAYAERAGRAEGKAEALEQVAPPAGPVQVVLDPDAQPGGRRRLDPPKLPDSAPPP